MHDVVSIEHLRRFTEREGSNQESEDENTTIDAADSPLRPIRICGERSVRKMREFLIIFEGRELDPEWIEEDNCEGFTHLIRQYKDRNSINTKEMKENKQRENSYS